MKSDRYWQHHAKFTKGLLINLFIFNERPLGSYRTHDSLKGVADYPKIANARPENRIGSHPETETSARLECATVEKMGQEVQAVCAHASLICIRYFLVFG